MIRTESEYPSDLTEHEWDLIKEYIPKPRTGGRPRSTDMRRVVDAILYLTKAGCQWRYLPKSYPPWRTVYEYFKNWWSDGVWRRIHRSLVKSVREKVGRGKTPNRLIVDSQSVRAHYGKERGWDGFKKVRGRKRQIFVDSLGFIWALKVHGANVQDPRGAVEAAKTLGQEELPKNIIGDLAYAKAPFDTWTFTNWGIWPEVPRDKAKNLGKQRWVVERTFAWFNNSRRLSRDYEKMTGRSEAFLLISQLPILLRRITKNAC